MISIFPKPQIPHPYRKIGLMVLSKRKICISIGKFKVLILCCKENSAKLACSTIWHFAFWYDSLHAKNTPRYLYSLTISFSSTLNINLLSYVILLENMTIFVLFMLTVNFHSSQYFSKLSNAFCNRSLVLLNSTVSSANSNTNNFINTYYIFSSLASRVSPGALLKCK